MREIKARVGDLFTWLKVGDTEQLMLADLFADVTLLFEHERILQRTVMNLSVC